MCYYIKKLSTQMWRVYGKPKMLICVPLVLLFIYCEWFCYFILPIKWPNLNCGLANNLHRILFVADPQILGENTESLIARIDSDLDLKSTFSHALNYVNPDLIIFLGDLMDEGSLATPQQYARYYRRFTNIFQLDEIPRNKTIFIPGDNDIGGEDEEVTEYKIRRFRKHFPSTSDVIRHRNMTFFEVNSMTKSFPDVNVGNDTLRIIISHIPLLGVHSTFGEQAISRLKPLLVFSAHDHKPVHLVTGQNTPVREMVELLDVNKSAWRFNLRGSGRVNEIVIPTSSYRMGTIDFGYGVALLSTDGDVLCYFTLWSPRRLLHLIIYLIAIPLILLIYLLYFMVKLCIRPRRKICRFSKFPV